MVDYNVRLIHEADKLDVTIKCPSDKFILEGAEENNIELPYSCRAGSCSTCLGKVTSGTVDQADQTFCPQLAVPTHVWLRQSTTKILKQP